MLGMSRKGGGNVGGIMEDRENNKNVGMEDKQDEIHRITVSKMAEEALTETVERVNDGFEGGKVNRVQVANWILMRFNASCSDGDIQQIRAENVNEISVLEAILKKARKSGKLPSELSSLIQKQLGFDDLPKKMAKSRLTKNIINDDMVKMEE